MFITPCSNQNFSANLNSPKLKFRRKDFYIRIKGYGKNPIWAFKTVKTADTAVDLIRNDINAEEVLKFIASGIRNANKFCLESFKRKHSGILRTFREGWDYKGRYSDLITGYGEKTQYQTYKERFKEICQKPLTPPKYDIGMTQPKQLGYLRHGKSQNINPSLDYVFNLCNRIFPQFIHQEVKPENMKEINNTIAEIRWVLAHSTPWVRGSDAIANVFVRAIYKSIGVKTYPLKKGISLDLEAYCTQLSEYKGRFSNYFEKPPEIIE